MSVQDTDVAVREATAHSLAQLGELLHSHGGGSADPAHNPVLRAALECLLEHSQEEQSVAAQALAEVRLCSLAHCRLDNHNCTHAQPSLGALLQPNSIKHDATCIVLLTLLEIM